MANDYMAKLAADLEGMSMMREPEPMPIIYRQEGGDTYGEETADISGSFDDGPSGGGANEGGADDGTYTQDQMASLVETLGPDVQDPAGEQVGISPVGDGPMFSETRGLLEGIYNLAPGTLDFYTGVGREGYSGEFTGIDSPTSKNVNDIIDTMPSWLVPYYNAEKEKGKTNAETVAALQQALSIPGGAARMASGYSAGYSFGGPGGTMQDVIDNYISDASVAIKAAENKIKEQDKEDEEPFDEPGEFTTESKDYFGDIVGGITNYFTGPPQDDINLMSEAVKQAGFTFNPTSDAENYAGMALSYLAPNPIGPAKGLYDVLAFATDSRIIGDVTTPYGTFQLTESGDLQTTDIPDQINDPGGNEPVITKKRKVATEKTDDEEDKEEEVDKPYFPNISTATLTPSELNTLTNIYGPDSYLLNENQTGLRTLV